MPEIASPYWLLLVPPVALAVWWLHRFREKAPRVRVSAVFLWQGLGSAESAGNRLERAEPVWLLRALVLVLVLAALAGPGWIGKTERKVTVWFDDSPSMQAQEAGGVRWKLAASRLVQALRQSGVTRVEVRSLRRPQRRFRLAGSGLDQLGERLAPWFRQPLPEQERPLPPLPLARGEHWLVSDGADPDLARWAAAAGPGRILQAGEATENRAIVHLGLRRDLASPDRLEGLARIRNAGRRAARQNLVLLRNGQPLGEWSLHLPPGQEVVRTFGLPLAGTSKIEAMLAADPSNPDHLPLDDGLELEVTARQWQKDVALRGECGGALEKALATLPGVRLVRGSGDLSVVCSDTEPDTGGVPTLWFRIPDSPVEPQGPLRWLPPANDLHWPLLERRWLRTATRFARGRGTSPLLSAGEHPLVLLHPGKPMMLEVRLDMEHPLFTGQPAYPLLIGRLAEYALGSPLLDRVAARSRNPLDALIAPAPLPLPAAKRASGPGVSRITDLGNWPILLALALLLVDLGRTFARAQGTGPAGGTRE